MTVVRSELDPPSPFFVRHIDRLRETASIGPVLDLACGRGRHSFAAARLGLRVQSVDRNAESLASLADLDTAPGSIETREVDLEGAIPPDLGKATFGAVLVFRYLHRPLMPWIESLLAPGGVLFYETFTTAQRELGWGPSRDDFLLNLGELPKLFPNLCVDETDEGMTDEARPAMTARLLAHRPG